MAHLERPDKIAVDRFIRRSLGKVSCTKESKEFLTENRETCARAHVRKNVRRGAIVLDHNAEITFTDDVLPVEETAEECHETVHQVEDLHANLDKETVQPPSISYPGILFGILCLKFALPQKAMAAVLQLLKLRLDFSKVGTIEEILQSLEVAPIVTHIICRSCGEDLVLGRCLPECEDTIEETFITGSLNSQLQHIVKDEFLFRPSLENFRKDNRITDITDGVAYRKCHEENSARLGLQLGDCLVTLIANTDGLQLNQSGCQSACPVFGMVAEINTCRRAMTDKTLNRAPWSGEGKPPIEYLMRNLQAEMNDLNNHGIAIQTAGGAVRIFVHAAALVADMPAKAMLCNTINFNGAYGCSLCDIQGFSVPSGKGHCRAYIRQPREALKARTHLDTLQQAEDAERTQRPVFGQKRIPRVQHMRFLDYSNCFLFDEMHGFLLSVVKKLWTMWTEDAGRPYYLGKDKVARIQQKLLSFRVPQVFTRLPRKLKIHQYKANEFRNLINHFSVFCLAGALPARYLDNYRLLVASYKILCSSEIHPAELGRADSMLKQFVDDAVDLYGQFRTITQTGVLRRRASSMTFKTIFGVHIFRTGQNVCGINVHSLLHAAEMVNMWGPLWAYSLFPFESKNGYVARHCFAKNSILRSVMMQLLGCQ